MTQRASHESGHDKNLSNFYALVQFCETLGPSYQPARSDLALTALHEAYTGAKAVMDALHRTEVELSQAITSRLNAFEPLPGLATRIVNLLRAGNANAEVLKAARHYSGKLHNRRLGPAPGAATPNAEAAANAPEKSKGSVIQSSFDSRLAHMQQMVHIAEADPTYASTEADLKTATLNDVVNQLVTLNRSVVELTHRHRLLISGRKNAFYSSIGLVARSQAVRHYITARYGVRSQEEKAANAFLLKTIK